MTAKTIPASKMPAKRLSKNTTHLGDFHIHSNLSKRKVQRLSSKKNEVVNGRPVLLALSLLITSIENRLCLVAVQITQDGSLLTRRSIENHTHQKVSTP